MNTMETIPEDPTEIQLVPMGIGGPGEEYLLKDLAGNLYDSTTKEPIIGPNGKPMTVDDYLVDMGGGMGGPPSGMDMDMGGPPSGMDMDMGGQPSGMDMDMGGSPSGMGVDMGGPPSGMDMDMGGPPSGMGVDMGGAHHDKWENRRGGIHWPEW